MALANALKRFKNSLSETFHLKSYNPEPGRNRVKLALANARKQFGAVPPSKAPNKLWQIGHDGALKFTLKLNGNAIPLGGEQSNYMPSGEFEGFLDDLHAAVDAGELDNEIKAALESTKGGVDVGGGKTSAPRKAASGQSRQSKIAPRADGLPHRVPAAHDQPHGDYTLNKAKTHWRSPEQVAQDEKSYAARSKKA